MEILFSILCAIFAVLASIFGVRNRINNSRTGVGGDLRNSGSRLDDIVSDNKRLDGDKERIQELDRRDDDNIKRCNDISSRLRKKEPETNVTE